MVKRTVRTEIIEHLPSELHKMVAAYLIRTGEWHVADEESMPVNDSGQEQEEHS